MIWRHQRCRTRNWLINTIRNRCSHIGPPSSRRCVFLHENVVILCAGRSFVERTGCVKRSLHRSGCSSLHCEICCQTTLAMYSKIKRDLMRESRDFQGRVECHVEPSCLHSRQLRQYMRLFATKLAAVTSVRRIRRVCFFLALTRGKAGCLKQDVGKEDGLT